MTTHDPLLTRASEWRDAFEALIRDRMQAPFTWGAHDCCLFAADAVLAKSGVDPAADLRGTYSTAAEAVDVLAKIGGIEAAGARCGEPIAPLFAQVGDIGLVEDSGRDMLAVCVGAVWLVPGATGLGSRPIAVAKSAWRVACRKQQ